MKIKVLPILYRAVYEGVEQGLHASLEEGRKPENAENPDVIKEVVSTVVMQHLLAILDLNDETISLQGTETNEQTEVRQ